MSQTPENEAILRRFFEDFLNAGNVAVADEICAADYLLDFPAAPAPMDREGFKDFSATTVPSSMMATRIDIRIANGNIVEDVVEADWLGCRSSSAPRVS